MVERLLYFGCQEWGGQTPVRGLTAPPPRQSGARAFIDRVGGSIQTEHRQLCHLGIGRQWSEQRHLVLGTVTLQFQSLFVSIS